MLRNPEGQAKAFDIETEVTPLGGDAFAGRVHPSWNIAGSPNGGYLLALAVSALRRQLPQHPDPLSVTAHYLRPGLSGKPCQIDSQILRSGKSLSTARTSLVQDCKARLDVLAAFGDLGAGVAPTLSPSAPDIPPPERCVARSGDRQGVALPILDRLEVRLHPDEAFGEANAQARIAGWVRFQDGRDPDSFAALLFADAFPPAVFGLLGVVGWVPTIELTVHVRRRPAPGWILGQFVTVDMTGGRLIEDGTLWDSSGVVFAQSRQLAMLLPRG